MAERVEVAAEAQRSARARFAQQRLLVPGEEEPQAKKTAPRPAGAPAAPRAAAPSAHVEAAIAVAPEGDAGAVAVGASSLVDDLAPVSAATLGAAVAAAPVIAAAEVRQVTAPAPAAIAAAVLVNPAATLGVEPVEGASIAAGIADGIRIATDGGAPFDVWGTVNRMGSYQAAHAEWWAAYARAPEGTQPAGALPTLDVTGTPPPADAQSVAPAAVHPRPDTSAADDPRGPRVTAFRATQDDDEGWVNGEPLEPAEPAPPPPPPPVVVGGTARQTEYFTMYGEPETVSAVDCVTTETKLATLSQVLGPEQAAAFEALQQQPDFNIDAAFMAVLGAARLAGVHDVNIGGLVAHLTVDEATGLVNGKPLASDAELALAPRFSNLTMEQRKAELRQLGVSELFLNSAGTHQVIRAFNELELRRMRGVTGDVSLNLADTLDTAGVGARIENTGLPVPFNDKVATIQTLLSGADRAAFDQMLTNPAGYSHAGIDAAFDAILAARASPGSKSVAIDVPTLSRDWMNDTDYVSGNAHFTATMGVDAFGQVNGQALAVDQAARAAPQVANASPADKDQALLAAGFSGGWVAGADQALKDYALARVSALSRVPGAHALDFTTQQVTYGESDSIAMLDGRVTLQVGADGINGSNRVAFRLAADGGVSVNGQPPVQPLTDAQLKDLSARETREWPGGTPEGRIRNRLEDVPGLGSWVTSRNDDRQYETTFESPVSTSEKIAAIEGALSGAQLDQFHALINGNAQGFVFGQSSGVDPNSVDRAFEALLEARQTPGTKPLQLMFAPMMQGREGEYAGQLQAISLTISVDDQGKVNGKPLTVDTAARFASELVTIPAGVKDQALADAGFSSGWIGAATQAQKDYALGRLRALSLEPGVHTLDMPLTRDNWRGETTNTAGLLTLNVTADGKVNGKTQLIEAALATQLTMERMSMSEKRTLLVSFGVPTEAARIISPDEATALLTQIAFAQRTPGEHQFSFNSDGDWQMMVRISGDGKVEAAGAARTPKDESWRMVVSMVLTIVSIAFPVVAPVCAVIQAGLAYDSGVRGLGLVAAVAGAVAGVSGMADAAAGATTASTTTSTLSNIASVLQATSAAKNAIEGGSVLGVFASVVSLASAAGNLAGQPLGADFDVLIQAGKYAGYADRIARGDFQGLFTAAIGDAARANPVPGGGPAPAYGDREGDPPVNADGTPFVGTPGVAPEPAAPRTVAPAPLSDLDAPTLNTSAPPPALNAPVYGENEGDPPVNADGSPFVGAPRVPADVAADPYVGFRTDGPAPVGRTPGYGNNEGDPPVNADGSPFDVDQLPVTAPDGAAPVGGAAPVDGAAVEDVTPVDPALAPGRPIPFPVIGSLGEAEGVRLGAATPTPGMLMALGEFDPNKPVTVLVHQYAGAATDYQALAGRLTAEGMQVMVLAYDSRGTTVVENARILNEELARLAGQMTDTSNINIVGHSMGGVVVRAALATTGAVGTTGPFDHYTVRTVDAPLEGMAAIAPGFVVNTAQAILGHYGQAGLGELLAGSAPYRMMETPLDQGRVDFQQTFATQEAFFDVRSVPELSRWELNSLADFLGTGAIPDGPGYASARNMAYTLRDDSRFGALQAAYAARRTDFPDEHPSDALVVVVEQVMPRAAGDHSDIIRGTGSAGTVLVDRLAAELGNAAGLPPPLLAAPPVPSAAAPVSPATGALEAAPHSPSLDSAPPIATQEPERTGNTGPTGPAYGDNEGDPPVNANGSPFVDVRPYPLDDEGNLVNGAAAFHPEASEFLGSATAAWAAVARDRVPLIGADIPASVADIGALATVTLSPHVDGRDVYNGSGPSGAVVRVTVEGEARYVLLTTAHSFGSDGVLRENGVPREISDYTLVVRGREGQVVIDPSSARVDWNGSREITPTENPATWSRDAVAIPLTAAQASALVGADNLARLPTIGSGTPAPDTALYAFGYPDYTRPDGAAAARLLVGATMTAAAPLHPGFAEAQAVVSERNPANAPGSSGGPVFSVGPNGEIVVEGLISGGRRDGPNQDTIHVARVYSPQLGLEPVALPQTEWFDWESAPATAAPAAPASQPANGARSPYVEVISDTADTQEGAAVDATEEMPAAPPVAAAPPAPAPTPAPAAASDGGSGDRSYAGGGSGRVGGGGGRGGRGLVNDA